MAQTRISQVWQWKSVPPWLMASMNPSETRRTPLLDGLISKSSASPVLPHSGERKVVLDIRKALPYIGGMIKSFRSKALRNFAAKGDASKLSVQNSDRVARILSLLDAATAPDQLNIPGLKFHMLKGKDKGRYSVWATGNYRVTFAWEGEDAVDVDLEDYH